MQSKHTSRGHLNSDDVVFSYEVSYDTRHVQIPGHVLTDAVDVMGPVAVIQR